MHDDMPPRGPSDYAAYAQGVVDSVRQGAEDAIEVALEILGETIPKLVNGVLAVLAAGAFALIALGVMAIFATTLFIQLLAIIAGVALIVTGVLLFALAWRLHAATAGVRTVANVARKWRAKRMAREPAPRDQA